MNPNQFLYFNEEEKAFLTKACLTAKIWESALPEIEQFVKRKMEETHAHQPGEKEEVIRQFVESEIRRQFPIQLPTPFVTAEAQQPFKQKDVISQATAPLHVEEINMERDAFGISDATALEQTNQPNYLPQAPVETQDYAQNMAQARLVEQQRQLHEEQQRQINLEQQRQYNMEQQQRNMEQQLRQLQEENRKLNEQVEAGRRQLDWERERAPTIPQPTHTGGNNPFLFTRSGSPPRRFSGTDRNYTVEQFNMQLVIYFQSNQRGFERDEDKCWFTISLLEGNALTLLMPTLERFHKTGLKDSRLKDFSTLTNELQKAFGTPLRSINFEKELMNLTQTGDVGIYIARFKTLALNLGWEDSGPLRLIFRKGLKENILAEMARLDSKVENRNVDQLQTLAERAGNGLQRIKEWEQSGRNYGNSNTGKKPVQHTPRTTYQPPKEDDMMMDLDKVQTHKISKEEREKRIREKRCLHCGKEGHYRKECRKRLREMENRKNGTGSSKPVNNKAVETTEEKEAKEDKEEIFYQPLK